MPKLNICLVTYEFPPFHWIGGEGAYTAELSHALLKLGHEVIVLTTSINRSDPHNARPQVLFVDTINKPPFRLLSFYSRARAKIREIGMNTDLDIVHYTNDYCGPIISKEEINRPIIATMHHPYVAERRVWRGNVEKSTFKHPIYLLTLFAKDISARRTCKKATKIIAVSRFTAEGIISEYGILPGKMAIIPNCVDTIRFNPNINGEGFREKWKLHSDPLVVFVGRLVQNKGLQYLVEAFAEVLRDIPEAKLIIAGEGTLKKELLIMIRKLNLQNSIKLVGRVPSKELPAIYAAADLVVLPSIMEGFGMTLLEAMATAKPCVATAVGGIPEVVINGETGLLVPPGDSSALHKAICTVLEDRSLSRKLGEAGCRRVENRFTSDIVAKETVVVYEQTLERSRRQKWREVAYP